MAKDFYRVACARLVGTSHAKTSAPCQDFVGARVSSSVAVAALADGAGSRSRSAEGATVVVKTILRFVTSKFDELFRQVSINNHEAKIQVHTQLVQALDRAAKVNRCSLESMASTLLFIAVKRGKFISGHIGDGVIALVKNDSSCFTFSTPENGEYANSTFFITDKTALYKLRLNCGIVDSTDRGFVLMSDGCAESLFNKRNGRPAAAVAKIIDWSLMHPRSAMEDILCKNLKSTFSQKSSDDCSLALLSMRHEDCVPLN